MTAQKRYFNFEDDATTADLIRWYLGIIPKGLYYGFDAAQGDAFGTISNADMNLRLNHALTGQFETTSENVLTANRIGKFVTPQGIVTAEDNTITLPINPNTSGNARIDLVVATAEYVEIEGGADVEYAIVQGTPSATPVAPALPFPAKQIVLGQITIPNGTTANLTGRRFIKSKTPLLGNMPDNYAYFNIPQVWSQVQAFKQLSLNEWVDAFVDGGVQIMEPSSGASSLFKLTPIGTDEINRIEISRGSGALLFIRFDAPTVLLPTGNIKIVDDQEYPVQQGETIMFIKFGAGPGSYWQLISQQSVLKRRNHFLKLQSWNPATASLSSAIGLGEYDVLLSENGNHFVLDLTAASVAVGTIRDIRLKKEDDTVIAAPDGTLITLRIVYNPLLQVQPPILSTNFNTDYTTNGVVPLVTDNMYKGATNYLGGSIRVYNNDRIVLLKENGVWFMVSWPALTVRQMVALRETLDASIATKASIAQSNFIQIGALGAPAYGVNVIPGGTPASYRKDTMGQIHFSGGFRLTSAATGSWLLWSMPVGLRPIQDEHFKAINSAGGDDLSILVQSSGIVSAYATTIPSGVTFFVSPISYWST